MGLLEQLLARLDTLNARLDALEGKEVNVTIQPVIKKAITEGEVISEGEVFIEGDHPAEPALELDKNCIPWDERIHAGTKRKNADGT